MALVFDPTQVTKMHIRLSDFFSSSAKYKPFSSDLDPSRTSELTDMELECLGYGHFQREKLLDQFCSYVREALCNCPQLKTLKITLSGFELSQGKSYLIGICRDIIKFSKDSIKLLWFHTANLSNCQLNEFTEMLSLIGELSHVNFQEISLQFSNWQFASRQPSIIQIEDIFTRLISSCQLIKINNQRFRLEISSWYYEEVLARQFLRFRVEEKDVLKLLGVKEKDWPTVRSQDKKLSKWVSGFSQGEYSEQALVAAKVQEFHRKIQALIRNLLEIMDHIKEFEIDFRNWNDILKMKALKKRLDNISKKDTFQKSIVSKRIGLEENQTETELRMVFVM